MSKPPDQQQSVSERHIVALAEILRVMPKGRWTTYGDVAKLLKTHAIQIGGYLRDPRVPDPYRVLDSKGRVSARFDWGAHNRADDPRELLESEGVAFDAKDQADRSQRITAEQLRNLLGDRADEVLVPATRKETLPHPRPPLPPRPASDVERVAAVEQALANRVDLRRYGPDARLLFAAELILGISDIHRWPRRR